jgi:signal transduction histidine kinase
LAELVRSEAEKQEPLAGRRSLALSLRGLQSLLIRGNENQLRQVIRNLLNNAIKFTPSGGQITCECLVEEGDCDLGIVWPRKEDLPAGRWAAVRVTDTGIGLDAVDIPLIFGRFYRVKTQGNIPGTGLGLAITRELVESHGGYVGVASTPGKGSSFAVYLPMAGEEA